MEESSPERDLSLNLSDLKSTQAGKKIDERFMSSFYELYISLCSIPSELIFAGIMSSNNHKLNFEKKYGFIIDKVEIEIINILKEKHEIIDKEEG